MNTLEAKTIQEHVQIECIARHGTVFGINSDDAPDYWQVVWDWLKAAHSDLLENPDVDYPTSFDDTKGDMALLRGIWQWQRRLHDEQ